MKATSLRMFLFVLFCTIVFIACNKETFIESIGNTTMESANDKEVGYFIFSSKTSVKSCGRITLWIDDKIVGYLTEDFSGAVNSCTTPPIEGKLVKIVTPIGIHKITATVENNCKKFNTDTYELKQGTCRYYNLN